MPHVHRSPVSTFPYHRGQPGGDGILVLSADTSAIDFTLFALGPDDALLRVVDGRLDQLYADARFHAEDATGLTVTDVDCADENPPGHGIAIEFLFNWLGQRAGAVPLLAVGHDVVHGGPRFSGPARLDAATLRYLQALVPLAPVRQRASLLAIRAIAQRWPQLPQVACFETGFDRDVPVLEHVSPIATSTGKRGLRRYRYDGLPFEAAIDALPAVDERAAHGKTIVVHVGDGASLCALDAGRKVAMAPGFDDLHGLAGTRSRRLDPGIVRHLMAELGMGSDRVGELLRQRSERQGGSGLAGQLDRLVGSKEPRARVAVEVFLYRISRELGALAAALFGLDAIVFTAATGPHCIPIRAAICRRASWLGVDLDPVANLAGGARITRPQSRVSAWVITADEHLLIARRTQAVLG
jgi:acetate kinase